MEMQKNSYKENKVTHVCSILHIEGFTFHMYTFYINICQCSSIRSIYMSSEPRLSLSHDK